MRTRENIARCTRLQIVLALLTGCCCLYTISTMIAEARTESSLKLNDVVLSDEAQKELEQIEWWKKTNFYHIYVRSFKDTTGNGEGDLRGVIEKLNYLKLIGVETLLSSPFYKSPMRDAGYDVSDYTDINEFFGNMADFDELIKEIHVRDMKLVVDFVPNHTSNLHEWFYKSERALIEPEKYGKYKDYYMWSNSTRYQDPKYGGRPSNWRSLFTGETGWRWSPVRKEFYLHQFLPEQPDLNLRNPLVREELKEVVRFWLRKGVDGFRVDAVVHFLEDEQMRDEPPNPNWDPSMLVYDQLDHIYTRSLREGVEVVKDWYEVLHEPEFGGKGVILTEGYDTIPLTLDYYGPNQEERYADMPFNFELLTLTRQDYRNPNHIVRNIMDWMRAVEEMKWKNENNAFMPWTCWVTGNHDNTRLVNRVGYQNIDWFLWLVKMLPGVPVIYSGDEIAVHDLDFSKIPAKTLLEGEPTRLIFRAPMAWNSSMPTGGFSTTDDTWLPMNTNFRHNNVKSHLCASGKTKLKNYIRGSQLRQLYLHTLVFGDYTFYKNRVETSAIFSMGRLSTKSPSLMLLANTNDHRSEIVQLLPAQLNGVRPYDVPKQGKVLMVNYDNASFEEGQTVNINGLMLEPNQAVVLEI